jgi:hypothetical protein
MKKFITASLTVCVVIAITGAIYSYAKQRQETTSAEPTSEMTTGKTNRLEIVRKTVVDWVKHFKGEPAEPGGESAQ